MAPKQLTGSPLSFAGAEAAEADSKDRRLLPRGVSPLHRTVRGVGLRICRAVAAPSNSVGHQRRAHSDLPDLGAPAFLADPWKLQAFLNGLSGWRLKELVLYRYQRIH